jgi:peptidyl-prolyl cis-trans isomerase C
MRLAILLFCSRLMLGASCLVPVAALAQGAPGAGASGRALDARQGSASSSAAAAGQPPATAPPATAPPALAPPATAQSPADPVVGSVEGHLIYLSDLGETSKTLPENLRGLPFDTLYPVLLDRMIDHEALVIMSRRKGLEQTRQVQHDIQVATERILEGAYLGQVAAPQVTEQAIQARFNQQYANRPSTEEVRARHILVTTEAEAQKVLDDLKKGADFATIARVISKDPDGAKGGDLGFFRREQVWPGFADVAFSLQPGQIAPAPIKNEFGWHVIKVEERRLVAPPSYADLHDQLRQELLAQVVQQEIEKARSQLAIHRFNLDGSELETGPRLGGAATEQPSLR